MIAAHKDDLADKTVVTFCTGGIRCERAAIHMQEIGHDSVYQLEGGILKYFEEVGGAHYTGDCFVFDYRTALKPKLDPTVTVQCSRAARWSRRVSSSTRAMCTRCRARLRAGD